MLPVKKRKVIFQRQRPLLHTHHTRSRGTAAKTTLNDAWNSVPRLVLENIFLLLSSPVDRQNVRLVCHHWNRVMNEPALWKSTMVCLPSVRRLCSGQWSLLQSRCISKLSLGYPYLSPSLLSQILKKLTRVLPHLQFLELGLKYGTKYHCVDLHSLSEFCDLRELIVGGTRISVTFPEMSSLKSLVVRGNSITPTFSKVLLGVETLTLQLRPLDTVYLSYFPHLKSLILAHSFLKSKLFTAKESHPTTKCIEYLDLSYLQFGLGLYLGVEKQFPNLRVLHLAHCKIPEWELTVILAGLQQLTELDLTDNDATDAVLAAVTAPLVSLTLQQTFRVTSYGLELLVRCCHHTLTSLDLSYSSGVMSVSELTQLEAWFPQLTILCLRGWTVPDDVRRQLNFKTLIM